jgi:tetratricopeptide (TPR) repeat protein
MPESLGRSTLRSTLTKWFVALVVLGAIAFLGATVGRKYITAIAPAETQTAPAASSDDRVKAMLEKGNSLLDSGDLEGAKEQFDKATALAEGDPAVLAAAARLAAVRADIHWLALKLIDEKAPSERSIEQRQLDKRVAQLDDATARATTSNADDAAVRRAKVDAQRLKGQLSKARELVSSLSGSSNEPETAYVLAALDMAEDEPVWSTVIERLRTAAGVEGEMGRARAALVYALARSGDGEQARRELEKLSAADNPHPLLPRLKTLVDTVSVTDGGAAVETPATSKEAESATAPAGGRGATPGGDFRSLLERAAKAKNSGDLAQAERLYRAARDKQPGNIEALAGLGDVARLRGDQTSAARFYDGVLGANPSYLPTLIARADQKWASGDRAGAVALYRKVAAQAGSSSSYARQAQSRIQEFQDSIRAPSEGSPSPASTPEASEPTEPTPPSAPEEPHIDTTDLPGFER